MCEDQKRYEKQKILATFRQLFGNSATFRQLLDTLIGNFFGIHRQLVAKPTADCEPTLKLKFNSQFLKKMRVECRMRVGLLNRIVL